MDEASTRVSWGCVVVEPESGLRSPPLALAAVVVLRTTELGCLSFASPGRRAALSAC